MITWGGEPPTETTQTETVADRIVTMLDECHDGVDRLLAENAELLAALKSMVASYDGIRDGLTSPVVIEKLARADAAIAKAEGR